MPIGSDDRERAEGEGEGVAAPERGDAPPGAHARRPSLSAGSVLNARDEEVLNRAARGDSGGGDVRRAAAWRAPGAAASFRQPTTRSAGVPGSGGAGEGCVAPEGPGTGASMLARVWEGAAARVVSSGS